MDNLESQTYEIFERDPVKYSQYQKVRCFSLHRKVWTLQSVLNNNITITNICEVHV